MRRLSCFLLVFVAGPALAQERPLPPPDRVPVLRLSQERPSAPVTSLAFAPDGSTLYVGGIEKLVRAYSVATGDAQAPIRIPVAPGNAGAVNAVAVSPDGKWLAVAGRAPMRGETRTGQEAVVIDTRQNSSVMLRDSGVIYVFDRTNPNRGQVLRGHQGAVFALAFADPPPADGPVLVSAALERDTDGNETGVLRAWDVAGAKEIAVRSGLPSTRTLPRLVAWSTGAKKGVRVAVAWRERNVKDQGVLRVWDTAANELRTYPDGERNHSLAVRRDRDGAVTAIVSGGFWNTPATGAYGRLVVRPTDGTAERVIPFPRTAGVHYLPLAVAAVGDSLVTLLETTAAPERAGEKSAELRLLSPDSTTVYRVPINGLSASKVPILTPSRDGRFVALAGFVDHRVEMFEVAALAAGRETRRVIGGETNGFTGVTFLDGGKLWLGEAGQTPTNDGLVFDFAARRVTTNDGKGKLDTAANAEIAFDTTRTPAVVAVTVAGQRAVYPLRPNERPTAAVYVPAWGKDRGPVVVVAHTETANEVTLVTVFDAITGRRLRQLVGPELSIQSLSFTASRSLLAAVGGDRTVTVWSLADLDKETGAIEGLRVTDNGTEVKVLTVAADSPAETRKIVAGDVIEGFAAANGKVDPVRTAAEFVWAIRSRRVGGTAAIRVKGKAEALNLPVGRGLEQRDPLFTLWLNPFGKAVNPDWVGWSPAGPYDASSPAAEARIGWLSNTGDPARPAAFDGADQHRKTYYRKDVLRFLVEQGELSSALEAQTDAYPLPPPRLTVQVVQAVPHPGGEVLLRDPKATLRVMLDDVSDDYPLERAVLKWRITALGDKPGAWRSVPLAGRDRTLDLDLSDHRWVRGHHAIEVTLHRTATSPIAVSAASEVPFAPPTPKLTVFANGKAVTEPTLATEANAIAFSAKIDSTDATDVTLTWTDPTGERGSAPLVGQENSVVKLKPGRTTIRLTATTRGAGEFAKHESHEVEVSVDFTPPKVVAAPRIGRISTTPAAEVGLAGEKPILITSAAKVRLEAAIDSADPITTVEWDDGDGKWVADPAGGRTGTVSHEVVLTLGKPRVIRLRAKSERSEFATAVAEVVHHPTLPMPQFTPLPAAVANAAFVVEGIFVPNEAAIRIAVLVASAGGTRQVEAVVDSKAGTWNATIPLEPGENRLGLLVRNDWRAKTSRNLTTITLRRPPRLLHIAPVDAGETGVADVVALASAADCALHVNGRVVETKQRHVTAFPGIEWWELTARAVPVTDTLKVTVRNTEGESEPRTVKVKRKVVPLQPPVIALADGPQDRAIDRPRTTLAFKVSSQSPLARVEVWHAGRAGGDFERVSIIDPTTATAVSDGFTLNAKADLELRPGVNQVRVVAVNSGGEVVANVAISYTAPGALVVIDGVDELGANGTSRALARKGELYEESVGGLVIVQGRVQWPADDATIRKPGLYAVLFANHIGHQPVRLEPVKEGASEFTFSAPVFLNTRDSTIRVELHATGRDGALPQQAASASNFRVKCKAPITQQRLHVVVIGVDVPPTERFTLAKQVVKSLGGSVPADRGMRFDRGEFKLGTFSQAILYPLVIGEVNDGSVAWALDEVNREVTRLSSGGGDKWLNDMVLVYYQGKDWTGPDGRRWLHTSRSLRYPDTVADRFAMRFEGLQSTPGVRLTVVNVANPGKPVDALVAGPPLLRYEWKDQASLERLFPLLEKAIAARRSLGDIVTDVRGQVAADPQRSGEPLEVIPTELRDRPIGSGSK